MTEPLYFATPLNGTSLRELLRMGALEVSRAPVGTFMPAPDISQQLQEPLSNQQLLEVLNETLAILEGGENDFEGLLPGRCPDNQGFDH
jgi:hypothetical protein